MWTWFLALAPGSLALAAMSAAQALATPSCAHRHVLWLHLLFAATVAANAALTTLAWRAGQRSAGSPAMPFSATLAFGLGALFTLLPLVKWLVVLLLPACA